MSRKWASQSGTPVTIIEPAKGWQLFGFRELWEFRGLLRALTMRDVKIRYKQTVLGMAWALVQPFFAMIVFTVALNGAAGVESEAGIPYPIFAFSGLVIWLYFAEAINRASKSLVANNVLVSKVYFPRLIAPLSGVISPLIDFCIAMGLLIVLMFWYGVPVTWAVLLTPLWLLAALSCAAAFGFWLAALNVEYRDVGYAVPLAVQLWMFLTPVVYPVGEAEGTLRLILALNPMAGIVSAFRWSILRRGHIDWSMFALSTFILAAVLVSGALYFRRLERTFADAV